MSILSNCVGRLKMLNQASANKIYSQLHEIKTGSIYPDYSDLRERL